MNAYQICEEWDNLKAERKGKIVENLFSVLSKDVARYEEFVFQILELAQEYEEDDYFGTEGLDL